MGGPPTPLLPTDDDDSCLVLSDVASHAGAKATEGEVGDVGPESQSNGIVASVSSTNPLAI